MVLASCCARSSLSSPRPMRHMRRPLIASHKSSLVMVRAMAISTLPIKLGNGSLNGPLQVHLRGDDLHVAGPHPAVPLSLALLSDVPKGPCPVLNAPWGGRVIAGQQGVVLAV